MKTIFTFLLLCVFLGAKSQTLSGVIANAGGSPVASASVTITNENHKIIAYTFSDKQGFFRVDELKNGNYTLVCRAFGYPIFSKKISVNSDKIIANINLGEEKSKAIKEIIITAAKPIVEKKDTIEMDVKAFLQGGERNAEELLKKIPGINVDEDGTVKIGNQEVEKIMIEGDDFFEKGYKILTKNFPVEPLDKVQILQRYSNNKHLKNIENSEKVALNLTLKKGVKRRWNDNADIRQSVFPEAFHQSKINLMNFGSKSKFYLVGGYNNIGEENTGNLLAETQKRTTDEYEKLGNSVGFSTIIEQNISVPLLSQRRINFNKDYFLSYNSVFQPSEKFKINLSGVYNRTKKMLYRNTATQYEGQGFSFRNNESQIQEKTMPESSIKLGLIYDISESKTLEFNQLFYLSSTDMKSDLVFNAKPILERKKFQHFKNFSELKFTKKITEQSVWMNTLKFIYENNPEDYVLSENLYTDFLVGSLSSDAVSQSVSKKQVYFGAQSYYTKRTEKNHLLELLFSGEINPIAIETAFALQQVPEPKFENQLSLSISQLRAFGKYHFIFDDVEISPQIEAFYIYNFREDFNQKQSSDFFVFNPKLSAKWQLSKKGVLQGNWFYNFKNTNALELLSNYVNLGFRHLESSSVGFRPLRNYGAFLYYNYGNWSDRFFVNTMAGYTQDKDYISENMLLSPNYNVTENSVFNNRIGKVFSATFGYYFRFLKSTLKLNFGGNEFRYQNQINQSELRNIQARNFSYGMELRSGWKSVFNYHIGARWSKNSVETPQKSHFTSHSSFLDLVFNLNKKLNIQLKNELYYFDNPNSKTPYYAFSDLYLRYDLPKYGMRFSLSGNNLFNQKQFSSYFINDVSRTETQFRLLPRYVMLGLEFRIK